MTKLPIAAIATMALLIPVLAGAQEANAPPPIPPAPSAPVVISPQAPAANPPAERVSRPTKIVATGPPIVLEVSKGALIRLPAPAATVFVTNPSIADVTIKTPSLIYLSALSPGETALYVVDAEDRVIMNSIIKVEHNLSQLHESLRSIAPGDHIAVNSVGNTLELKGTVASAARAEQVRSLAAAIVKETNGNVINRLSVVTPNEVNIRVRIAEVSRQALKAFGVNWSKAGGHFLVGGTGTFSGIDFPFTGNPITGGAISAENLLAGVIRPRNTQITAVLDALAQENLATLLAEPSLTVTNGQPASFLAGGEFPVPIVQSGMTGGSSAATAATSLSVEFKTFGVQLAVTPTILDAQHLSLKIRPEVSELDKANAVTISGFTIPALTTRRAETTVELGSGESFLLAGLLQNTDSQALSKFPWIGDIPVIGQLFRSQQFQRNETELVIIVTPFLAKPSPAVSNLAAPTDGYVAPTDVQQIISGRSSQQTPPAPPAPPKLPLSPGDRGPVGPAGFRLD